MIYSVDQSEAKAQFARAVDELCTYAKNRRKQGIPLSPLRRARLTRVLCERYMRHSITTWGPDVVDLMDADATFVSEHRRYDYAPSQHLLSKLADMILE